MGAFIDRQTTLQSFGIGQMMLAVESFRRLLGAVGVVAQTCQAERHKRRATRKNFENILRVGRRWFSVVVVRSKDEGTESNEIGQGPLPLYILQSLAVLQVQ